MSIDNIKFIFTKFQRIIQIVTQQSKFMKNFKLETPTSPFVLFFIFFYFDLKFVLGAIRMILYQKKLSKHFFVEFENFSLEIFGPKLF